MTISGDRQVCATQRVPFSYPGGVVIGNDFMLILSSAIEAAVRDGAHMWCRSPQFLNFGPPGESSKIVFISCSPPFVTITSCRELDAVLETGSVLANISQFNSERPGTARHTWCPNP